MVSVLMFFKQYFTATNLIVSELSASTSTASTVYVLFVPFLDKVLIAKQKKWECESGMIYEDLDTRDVICPKILV